MRRRARAKRSPPLARHACACADLAAGQAVRPWCPLYLYALPVTAGAGVLLWLASLAIERQNRPSGIVGWADAGHVGLYFAIALGPGVLGHTVLNFVVKYLPALVITVTLLLEPIVGTAIGILFGQARLPGPWTWAGAVLILLGCGWVSWAEDARNSGQSRRASDQLSSETASSSDSVCSTDQEGA